jgi:hypothetical protein
MHLEAIIINLFISYKKNISCLLIYLLQITIINKNINTHNLFYYLLFQRSISYLNYTNMLNKFTIINNGLLKFHKKQIKMFTLISSS